MVGLTQYLGSKLSLGSSSKVIERYDVIIAGAGISGLAAARYLCSKGRKVLVLESRDRIGGRIHSLNFDDADSSKKVDLGASFVHGLINNPLTKLSKQVPFELHLPPEGEETMALFEPGAEGKPEDADKSVKLEYQTHSIVFERLHQLAQESQDTPSGDASMLSALQNTKAGTGIYTGLNEEERQAVLNMSVMFSGWTGADLDDVSLKWWGFEREFRGPDAVVKSGYSTLTDWHHQAVVEKGGEVKLNQRVEAVESIDDGNSVQVKASVTGSSSKPQSKLYAAPYFLCSLPLGVMQHSPPAFQPTLPERRRESIRRLGMGLLNKILISYPEPWWHETAMSPQKPADWIFLKGSGDGKAGESPEQRLQQCNLFGQNQSVINGLPVLCFFLGPPMAFEIEKIDDATIQSIVHERLLSTVASPSQRDSVPSPRRIHVTRWSLDPHARGSYSYFPVAAGGRGGSGPGGDPVDMMEVGRPLWSERLGFCGEHTEPNHFASVHGPLLSGLREARRIESMLLEREDGRDDWDEMDIEGSEEGYRGLRP
ncbi:unnamed protein product [Jaminaea pallidilutea]